MGVSADLIIEPGVAGLVSRRKMKRSDEASDGT